jgi:hypothetical protein
MRSVFVFPQGGRSEAVATLDRLLPRRGGSWADGDVYVDVVDEEIGQLFADWEPHQAAGVRAAAGQQPAWAVEIGVSGRIIGTREVCDLVTRLLRNGGFATDDYSDHFWTLEEIESGAVVGGLRFFDFQTRYERDREQG